MTLKPAPPPGSGRAWFVMAFTKKDFRFYGPFGHHKTAEAFGRNALEKLEPPEVTYTVIHLPHETGAVAIAGDIIKPQPKS